MRTKPTIPPRHSPRPYIARGLDQQGRIPVLRDQLDADDETDRLDPVDRILADARVMGGIIAAFSVACAFAWWVLS